MRLRRIWRWWPAAVLAAVALLVYAAWPGRSTFTIAPETTHVTGPVDAEGYIDYPTALNERLGAGVTPETNANVLIWTALGPKPEGGTGMPPDYFRWLGIPAPPETGEYFIGSDKYYEKHLKDRPPAVDWEDPEDDEEPRLPADPKSQWFDRVARANKWPWTAADDPDLAAWLTANEKPLAILAEATRRPAYFNPLVARDPSPGSARLIGSLLPSVQKCREVTSALSCRAMNRTADGDFDGAWQDLMACQRLGRLLAKGGASLIEHLVGIAVVQIATTAQLTLLDRSAHPAGRIRGWQEDLRRLPPMPGIAAILDLGERFMSLDALTSLTYRGPRGMDMLNALADGPGPAKPGNPVLDNLFTRSIDWDPAFRNVNQLFDRWAAAARLPDRAARKQEYDLILADVMATKAELTAMTPLERAALGKSARGEMIGNILITLMTPAVEKIQNAADRIEQVERNLHVAVALAAYRADAGRYPATLNELAPKYLPTVPGDLFSGKPLVYRPTGAGYVLYSVGVNGVDEDGRWTDDVPPGDDPRVRMPVPEPGVK